MYLAIYSKKVNTTVSAYSISKQTFGRPCQVSSDTRCIKITIWNPCKSCWLQISPPPVHTAATEPISQPNPNGRSATNAFQSFVAFSSSWNRTKRRNAKERPYASCLRNTINLNHIGCERSDLFPSIFNEVQKRTQ